MAAFEVALLVRTTDPTFAKALVDMWTQIDTDDFSQPPDLLQGEGSDLI